MPTGAGICSVCGKKSYSPRSNKCEEHRTAKSKADPRNRVGGTAKEPVKESTAARVVGALPGIDAKTFSGKAPTAAEWEEKLTAVVVLGTMTYLEFAVIKPSGVPEPYATQLMERAAMTDEQAESIVEPFAHLMAGTKVNKDHGREAIEILAFAPAILSIVEWVGNVAALKRELKQNAGDGTGQNPTYIPATFETEPLRREVPNDVGSSSPQAPQAAEGSQPAPAVANFGGAGVWNPDQAPSARVHSNGTDMDDPDRALEAAHIALNGAAGNEDARAGGF